MSTTFAKAARASRGLAGLAGRACTRTGAIHVHPTSTFPAAAPLTSVAKASVPSARAHVRGFAAAADAAPAAAPASSEDIEMKGVSLQGRPLYLDMQATTPVDPRVLASLAPLFPTSYFAVVVRVTNHI
jgi:hypothetical protein